jgi:hypothetical protein
MEIVIKWLDKAMERFNKMQIATALRSGIGKSIFALEVAAKKETPVGVSGMLRNAYRENFSGLRGELVNTKEYAQWVHNGRKPGKMPPVSAISLWAKRKWIDIPPFVIARSIAKKGTKANPFMIRAMNSQESNIRSIIQGEIGNLISK